MVRRVATGMAIGYFAVSHNPSLDTEEAGRLLGVISEYIASRDGRTYLKRRGGVKQMATVLLHFYRGAPKLRIAEVFKTFSPRGRCPKGG